MEEAHYTQKHMDMTKYNPTCNVDSVSLLISASYQLSVQYYLLLKTQKPRLYISI